MPRRRDFVAVVVVVSDVVAVPGDRFVVRSYSPVITIGGGTLLDVTPPRFKRRTPALLPARYGTHVGDLYELALIVGARQDTLLRRLKAVRNRVPAGVH